MSEFPRPSDPYSGRSDLHFSTERDVRSRFVLGTSDRGELSFAPGRVTFRGMRMLVDCPQVSAVRLVPRAVPWASILILGVVAAAIATLRAQGAAVSPLPLLGLLALILLAVCLRYARERWVEVVYLRDGAECRAYFRRQPTLWGRGAVRTRELHEELVRVVLAPEAPSGL